MIDQRQGDRLYLRHEESTVITLEEVTGQLQQLRDALTEMRGYL